MTVRITALDEGSARVLRVDGRLVGDDVAELVRACEGIRACLTLDLAGVQFADGRAAGVLRDLRARGVVLVGATPYVRLLLGETATEDETG